MPKAPLGESLAALSLFFVGDRTVEATLQSVSELTLHGVASADLVGLTLFVDGRQRTSVFTDPLAPEIDQAQYGSGVGPCVEAFETGRPVRIASTLDDGPFAVFRAAAAAHGIHSTLSLPLRAGPSTLGAMNLYSRSTDGFDDTDREVAFEFAGHASVVLANARAYWNERDLSARLRDAIPVRDVIEQAKGILMGAQRCSADEAFGLLVAASQRENTKLRDVALRIVQSATSGLDAPAIGADQP